MLGFQVGFLEIRFVDILDIMLVTILLFNFYKLIKGSVALKVSIGFLAVYLLFLVVKATDMELLSSILGQFMSVGFLGALIIFQNEIRKFLLLIGKKTSFQEFTLPGFFKFGSNFDKDHVDISPIIDAMKILGGSNTGALIVISKDEDLKLYAETGDILDAEMSKRLLISIFFKNSPLHDGAVVIYKGRIAAARCILPVSENQSIPASMGLRHRAGIGITEIHDVAVLVVSEETGQLSYVRNGEIDHNLSPLEIRGKLNEYLSGSGKSVIAPPEEIGNGQTEEEGELAKKVRSVS